MKSKSRAAFMAGIVMVILLMPFIPNMAAQITKDAYVEAIADDVQERTASYDERAKDIVADTQAEVLKEESLFKGKAVAIDTEYLAVMTEPDSSSAIAGKLFEYNIADVKDNNNGWTKISSGNLTGYVETNALCIDSEAESVARLETQPKVAPKGEDAVLYASYKADAEVTGSLEADTEMIPVSRIGDYTKLMAEDGSYNYVLSDSVTIDYGFATGLTVEEEEAKLAAEEEARRLAEEELRRKEEEEAARIAAQEALRQEIISRTKNGTDFTYNPTMSISDEDLWVLACIIDWEAGWESYEGKLAVANIVLNRVRSSHYPDTVQDVVYARSQFGGVMAGSSVSSRFQERLNNGPRTDECMEAALEALSGKNNVGEFTAFNGSDVIDYSRLTDYMVIGGHCFY